MKYSDLVQSKFNARMEYPEEMIGDLSESIELYGLLSKIVLRKTPEDKYEVLAGWRRKLALSSIYGVDSDIDDSFYVVREVSDADAIKLSITENVQRVNFSSMELSIAAKTLKDSEENISVKDIAKILWSTEARVKRLLKLDDHLEDLPDAAIRNLSMPDELEPSFTDHHVEAMSKAGAFSMGEKVVRDVCDIIIDEELPASKVASVVSKLAPKEEEPEKEKDPTAPAEPEPEKPMQDKYKGCLRLDGDQLLIENKKGDESFDFDYYVPFIENREKFRVFADLKINIKIVGEDPLED